MTSITKPRRIAVLAGSIVLIAYVGFLVAGLYPYWTPERALDECFFGPTQGASGVEINWEWLPPGYECVYSDGRHIRL